MGSYELTERGKIVFALAILFILVVLTASTMFVVWALDGYVTPNSDDAVDVVADDNNNGEQPADLETTPSNNDIPGVEDAPGAEENVPDVGDTPYYAGDDTQTPPDDDDPEPELNDDDYTDDLSGDDEVEPYVEPTTGPVGFNRTAGTLNFLYTPTLQDSVDSDTVELIGELLTSPANTRSAVILIQVPQLAATETAAVTSAITSAFAEHNVTSSDILFRTFTPEESTRTHEITVSFYVAQTPLPANDNHSK